MNGKTTRRSFFGGAGAALAAPIASSAGFAGEGDGADRAAERLAAVEDLNAIRALEQRYARLVGAGNGEAMAALFASPGSARLDEHLRSVVLDGDGAIALRGDGTATSHVPCIVTTATPIECCGTLVEMARLQGDGFVARCERRVLEGAYVKRGGAWKIERVAYRSA